MRTPHHPVEPGSKAYSPVRPRLGLLCLTSGWFRDIGLQDSGSDSTGAVEQAAQNLAARLSAEMDVLFHGVIFSAAEAACSGRKMSEAEVDAVLLVPLMWCEEAVPRAALAQLKGVPVILSVFAERPSLPESIPFQSMLRGSGAVGSLQLSGVLKREGVFFIPVAGHAEDPQFYDRIAFAARGMTIKRRLHSTRVGVLPFPCDQMSSTWVDEFGLRARYGIALRYLEIERIRRTACQTSPQEISDMRALLFQRGVRIGVNDPNLDEGIRYSLALEKIMADEGLSVLAINDVIPEMHESFGLRPCLWNPRLSEAGAVVSMEADIAAAVAMHILRLATGEAPFYAEPLSADWQRNQLLLGHAGYHDASVSDPGFKVAVVSDVEYENSDRWTGAAIYFKYRPGPVTLVNCSWDGGSLKWVTAEGESLEGPPRLEGNCHLVFRADVPIGDFFRRAMLDGVTQHWIAVPGRRSEELQALTAAIGVRWTPIAR